jgi:hypothetical protein
MFEIKPLQKTLKLLLVTSDETRLWAEFVVQRFESSELVAEFESWEAAIEFCISEKTGFEVIDVNESWVRLSSKVDRRIKIIPDHDRVIIAEGSRDYWYGNLDEIDEAVEEVVRWDCDWEIVYCEVIEQELSSLEVTNDEEQEDDEVEDDSNHVELSPEDFTLAGSFKIRSARAYIGDPSEIEDYLKRSEAEKDVWTTYEGLGIFDFGDLASTEDKTAVVYVEENDEGRIVKALISFDGVFEDTLSTENFVVGNWLRVSSGQLMTGDPTFLEHWNASQNEEWNLEGKIGIFSYQGASATTLAYKFGVLADGESVVFNTGYGDGNYYVFFLIKDQSGETLGLEKLEEAGYTGLTGFAGGVPPGCEISKIVIDFITEVE